MKFKIGDTVTVRKWDDMEKEFGVSDGTIKTPHCTFIEEMNRFCSKKVTISEVFDNRYRIKEDGVSDGSGWIDEMFEESKKNKDGNITLLFRDNKTIINLPDGRTGVAKCNPTDKFDNGMGAVIALARAYHLDLKEVAKLCEKKEPRKIAEVGDYVIAKKSPFAPAVFGEVLQCYRISSWFMRSTDKKRDFWVLTGADKGVIQVVGTFEDVDSYEIISPEKAGRLIKEKNKENK